MSKCFREKGKREKMVVLDDRGVKGGLLEQGGNDICLKIEVGKGFMRKLCIWEDMRRD